MGNTDPVPPKEPSKEQPKKKKLWFIIDTRDATLRSIKICSIYFYIVAVPQILLVVLSFSHVFGDAPSRVFGEAAVATQVLLLVVGIVCAVCAFFLHMFNSRVAAIILLLLSGAGFISKIYEQHATILSVIAVVVSIQAVRATFKLRKFPPA